jgi:hypothetical protein
VVTASENEISVVSSGVTIKDKLETTASRFTERRGGSSMTMLGTLRPQIPRRSWSSCRILVTADVDIKEGSLDSKPPRNSRGWHRKLTRLTRIV